MHDDCELDRTLDAALRTYAQPDSIPEPAAMAARLLDQVRVRRVRRTRIFACLLPSAGCALAVLGILWLLHAPPAPQIAFAPRPPAVVTTPSPSPLPARSAPRIAPGATRRPAPIAPLRLPKRDVFPTPAPLSPQELRLARFATQAPSAVKQQALDAQQHLGDPIRIAQLTIRLLDDNTYDQPAGKDLP
jgi:hypothetical protein